MYKQNQPHQNEETTSKQIGSCDIQSVVSTHFKSSSFQTGSNLTTHSSKKEKLQQTSSVDESAAVLNEKLFRAILANDDKAVKNLIQSGADANTYIDGNVADLYAEDKYKTVLMLAARHGNANIIKALLNAGARVNDTNGLMGITALMVASQQNHADIVKILIKAGADTEAEDLVGNTALISAARGKANELHRDTTLEAVKALIAGGANVNAANRCGDTPLMNAARLNHAKTIRALINAGADVNATNQSGLAALDFAEQTNAFEAYNILSD